MPQNTTPATLRSAGTVQVKNASHDGLVLPMNSQLNAAGGRPQWSGKAPRSSPAKTLGSIRPDAGADAGPLTGTSTAWKPTLCRPTVDLSAGREYFEWDYECPGLARRFRPRCQAVWVVQFRKNRRQKRLSLGAVSALCVADARREARRILGADRPFSACTVPPKLDSFAETFLADCAHHWKPNTLEAHASAARSIVRSGLGAKRVNTICRSDVVHWLESQRVQCTRTLSVLSSMMKHAEMLGYRLPDTNPCAGLRRKKIGFSGSCPSDQDYKAIDRALAKVAESNPDVTSLLLTVMPAASEYMSPR